MPPPDDVTQDVLQQERIYHDRCRAALAAMVDGADHQVRTGEDVSASGADAEVLGQGLRGRAKELREMPPGPLFFGRMEFVPEAGAAGGHAGQVYHVGRTRISGEPAEPPLVVDWRAPVCRAFYQAGPGDPLGLAVRRRFGWAAGSLGDSADLTALEDERLDAGQAGGGQIVAQEIERPRTGPMRDIAATIQPEQDALIRAAPAVSLCVQGAPGTGKTAVGLHRAAYLLYGDGRRGGSLLVLGPDRGFLDHIAAVLPSLGETGVRQTTVEEEIARHPVTAEDDPRAIAVKHDPRMAEVLSRALWARVRPERAAPLVVPDGARCLRVGAERIARIAVGVRAEGPLYGVGRERVAERVAALVRAEAERGFRPRSDGWTRRIARSRTVAAALREVWPRTTPEEVLTELLSDPALLAEAARGVLSQAEQTVLIWAGTPRQARRARWSGADLVLLDEVAGLIERPAGYRHIVVDEAQDLSPMQCRAVARRAAHGSLTVLGDLAQGTTPWAAADWPGLLAHLGREEAAVTRLTEGFRLPAAVAELANRLLPELGVDLPPVRAPRPGGEVRVERVADPATSVLAAVTAALRRPGSVGVIAAGPAAARLREALTAAGHTLARPGGTQGRVTVLPASAAKGLEYDHVIAVEPAEIVRAEPRGLHRLYVVLTRAVSRLHVLHTEPLPGALAGAASTEG
ncbi:Helicase IV [Streptomyces sp. ADI96-15]|uniref:HelD family protein n=1 Tax=Streptomyces TaxID=1883 RepID=UPI0003C32066|nr:MULTISPECIES: AAA family ATPase [Streptomyces]ESQ00546.1 ATP/GTP binding protein [Streptomyces sp. GBA 94-10 4N24]ESQ06673.1 ATP/GTP binding protein [Streptomyces sp. PVA_94-07]RPK55101.1 Helicase IV [Streptomyces sp. ADI96-15]RWZ77102.1 AAA family ATPase [Streptomyces albidoflavus]UZN58173.1 ATP/GTP binding protein [Streptomyces sp. GBA 94-10 4N24]